MGVAVQKFAGGTGQVGGDVVDVGGTTDGEDQLILVFQQDLWKGFSWQIKRQLKHSWLLIDASILY